MAATDRAAPRWVNWLSIRCATEDLRSIRTARDGGSPMGPADALTRCRPILGVSSATPYSDTLLFWAMAWRAKSWIGLSAGSKVSRRRPTSDPRLSSKNASPSWLT